MSEIPDNEIRITLIPRTETVMDWKVKYPEWLESSEVQELLKMIVQSFETN